MNEFLGISILEWLGYTASVIVLISLSMASIVKLRWFNMLGAALFSTYGFLINVYPVGIMNLLIVFANIYYLIKMNKHRENFKIVEIKENKDLLNHYLNLNKKNIAKYFPHFTTAEGKISLFVFHDMTVAGIFIGELENDLFKIDMDYIPPQYRSFKVSKYLYKKLGDVLSQHHVKYLVCDIDTKNNLNYIKIGFQTHTHNEKNDAQNPLDYILTINL